MVISTVKGDIHDIGKNLVSMMMRVLGSGFLILASIIQWKSTLHREKHEPDILGMSALLTTTMPYMKVVVDALKKNLRDKYIVLVGGAPLNEEFGEAWVQMHIVESAEIATTAVRLVTEEENLAAL